MRASATTLRSPTTLGTLATGGGGGLWCRASSSTTATTAPAITSAAIRIHGQTGPRERDPGGSTIAPGGIVPAVCGSHHGERARAWAPVIGAIACVAYVAA